MDINDNIKNEARDQISEIVDIVDEGLYNLKHYVEQGYKIDIPTHKWNDFVKQVISDTRPKNLTDQDGLIERELCQKINKKIIERSHEN